ncbi:MAG: DNA polymerase/3'-5' exonuclease PolX [Candidatus Micrarchaeaceae archaeon]
MNNQKIALMFYEIADMLSLDEKVDRKFEVLAYRKAAQTVESLQEDIEELYRKEGLKGLMKLPGIGKSTASAIEEYIKTGRISKYTNLKKRYPIDFDGLTKIQGIGAKSAFRLYQELKIRNVEDLKEAVKNHRIQKLSGFGEKSEDEIAKGIAQLEASKGRMLLGTALPEAEFIVNKFKESGLVETAVVGGSVRRMKETVGDIDILVIAKKSEPVMSFFASLPEVERVIGKGTTKTTVLLKIGITCDVRVVESASFGAALQYFTGNKDHNVKLREIAIKKGYRLNEYGLFDKKGRSVGGATEEEVYAKLGLQAMPPEMREDRGEIDLALEHRLPELVRAEDIIGDFHVHTNRSDGANTIEEMALAARKLGRKYIGISDHSKNERVANGMDDRKFAAHLDEIEKLDGKIEGIRILKGAEVDILKDGSLDLGNRIMDRMDYRLASIHTNLNLSRDEMTKRVIKAFETGYVSIWAHPTDRIINKRQPINVDLDRVFEAAKDNGVIVEIDSLPDRLDLNDENIMKARKFGLKFAIDTDSHSVSNFELLRYGIGMARRGWLTKGDVINTLGYDQVIRQFRR